jgi:hypothetical protein
MDDAEKRQYMRSLLEQPIIEALWDVVRRPVGGVIEHYNGRELIARGVSPDVRAILEIRGEYVRAQEIAFDQLVDRAALLVESLGAKPAAGKGYDDHGSAFTTLVYEIVATAPDELQVHGVRRIQKSEGNWGAINQATYRALRMRKPFGERPELRGESLEEVIARAEHALNLKPERDVSLHDRTKAIQDAMQLGPQTLYGPDSPPEIKAGFAAFSAYCKASAADLWDWTVTHGVHWHGLERGWCVIAYGVTPPEAAVIPRRKSSTSDNADSRNQND